MPVLASRRGATDFHLPHYGMGDRLAISMAQVQPKPMRTVYHVIGLTLIGDLPDSPRAPLTFRHCPGKAIRGCDLPLVSLNLMDNRLSTVGSTAILEAMKVGFGLRLGLHPDAPYS